MTFKIHHKALFAILPVLFASNAVQASAEGSVDLLNGESNSRLNSADQLGLTHRSPSQIKDLGMQKIPAESSVRISQEASPTNDTFAPLSDDEIRQLLLIDSNAVLDRPQPIPSSSFLTPSAYGAAWGNAYIGIAGATAGDRSDLDGSASVGVGFGDAVENLGVELSVGIISLDGFADDGIVGFKLHKIFPEADNLAVALGWANPIKWGAASNQEDTFYGVLTQRFDLQPEQANTLPLTASVGIGTGTFRSTGAIAARNNAPNIFGSVALRVIPEVSVISSWTGSGLGFGVSAAPFEFPLILTTGVSDVTDNTVEGPRFHGAIGYSFAF
jgi:hypothetical protein